MDRPMEFEEVRDILKQVIPAIKDGINTRDLIDHMDFTVSTIHEIRAQIGQNGMPGSSHHFFDAVRQKPKNFIIMMAALLKIDQKEIYKRIYKYMRDTYYKDNSRRFNEVLKMIQNDVDRIFHYDRKPQVYPEVADNSDKEEQAELSQCNITGKPTSSDQTSATPLLPRSSRSPPTPPHIQPEESPTVLPPKEVDTEVVYPRPNQHLQLTPVTPDRVNHNMSTASSLTDNTLADVCILDLQAYVFHKLAEELMKPCDQNKQLWWNYIVNNCDQIKISRKTQRIIEKSDHPGKELLDLLGDGNYTCSNLAELFKEMNMADALNVLEQNQNKELPQYNITGIPTSSDQTSATPLPPRSPRSPPTLPHIQPEGSPTVLPPKEVETEDNTLADDCILDLQANVFDKLAEELIKPCDQNKQLWWNYIVNNCDQINISRREQRRIEKSDHPGKEFLDLLGDGNYTCSNLAELFKEMNMADALNVLEQNQNKVVSNTALNNSSAPYKKDLERFDENNLNNAIQRSVKATDQKNINVTDYNTDQSLPPNIHTDDSLREQCIQPLQPSPSSTSLNSDLGQSNTSIQSGNIPNTVPNTFGSCTSEDEDALLKPTQSIAAVADPTGKTSTHNSEQEADKLRDDRVHQHDDDKSNLRSFQDLKINSDPSMKMGAEDNENVSHEFGSNLGQPALNIQAQGTVATARGVGPADNEKPFTSVTTSKQAEGQLMNQGTVNAYSDIHSNNLADNQMELTNSEFLYLNTVENLGLDSLESGNQSEQDEHLSRDESGAGTRPGNNNKDMDND